MKEYLINYREEVVDVIKDRLTTLDIDLELLPQYLNIDCLEDELTASWDMQDRENHNFDLGVIWIIDKALKEEE